jgi:hypothetical protein
MSAEEKELRQKADLTAFLRDVKNNNTAGCLCQANEYVVFSFTTNNNKRASLCVSRKVTTTSGYLVYRFGTKAKPELTFPADTLNSFSQFRFGYYYRGGGKQNAAMNVNSLHFDNGGFTYTLHDDWNSENGQISKGVIISNNKTGKGTRINAKGKVIGRLSVFANSTIVTTTDEL